MSFIRTFSSVFFDVGSTSLLSSLDRRFIFLIPRLNRAIAVLAVENQSATNSNQIKTNKESGNRIRTCSFFALDDACPHNGASLCLGRVVEVKDFGIVWSHAVVCPAHGWLFDLKSGVCDRAACKDLKLYETKVVDGNVLVKVDLLELRVGKEAKIPKYEKFSIQHGFDCYLHSIEIIDLDSKKAGKVLKDNRNYKPI